MYARIIQWRSVWKAFEVAFQRGEVKKFVKKYPNARTIPHGYNILHTAASKGNKKVVQWLIEEGKVNVNATTKYGLTVLHIAALHHTPVAWWLIKDGKVDVNARDDNGRTALHYAASEGCIKVVQCLIKVGKANVNAKDNRGRTALHAGAYCGQIKALQWLIKEGNANVNAKDNDGKTALHLGAWSGKPKVVQCLVKEGKANMNAEDNDGLTALQGAAMREWLDYKGIANEIILSSFVPMNDWGLMHLEVVKCLVEAGADISSFRGAKECCQYVANFRKLCKIAFLLGFHKRLGSHSSIIEFFDHSSMFEPALIPCIFEFLSESPVVLEPR